MSSIKAPGLAESWSIFTSHVRPWRLLQEDHGVKGALWLGRKPTSWLHIPANVVRVLFGTFLSPIYIFIPHTLKAFGPDFIKRLFWSIEWAKTPDAVLLESPGSLIGEEGKVASEGKYAVTGNKPRWLLKVEFRGTKVVGRQQVRYGRERDKGDGLEPKGTSQSLRKEIRQLGYTAISYAIRSAETLIPDSIHRLETKPENQANGKRKYSLRDRSTIALVLLDEYARARKTINGKQDGFEFIWLDEFCLCDKELRDEQEIRRERNIEVGKLADIFRLARRVVVFCHVEDCDHTGIDCPWGNRLFTMGEILYTPEVLQMTRSKDPTDPERLSSSITIIPGPEFRSDMQACAAEAKKWHLYNIMQHATNSGAVTWQSAIHSLVVEAIRRDEADSFYDHNFLGKALNGLLPRRSQLEDLRGVNGWADLAWLLELNQAYYNAALLAAVCKLADNDVDEYRWWGKPISPREGSERLEALVHAIPVTFRKTPYRPQEPALSIVGPESITLSHWLQRDSAGLYRNPEMRSLMRWAIGTYAVFSIFSFRLMVKKSPVIGAALLYIATMAFSGLELLVGTMCVEKEGWAVIEDRAHKDAHRWLQSQDPMFGKVVEWGSRQLIPEWDPPKARSSPPETPPPENPPPETSPTEAPSYVTLIDLQTGVFTRAVVTKRPNCMVPIAIHGSGITCMLLYRDKTIGEKPTTAVKVGMANLPPFVLAQAKKSGTVYIGSHQEKSLHGRVPKSDPPKSDPPLAPIKLER